MKIKCPAKINLFLNVLGIRDSMHELLLINQTINLYDEIELIITNNNSIVIESNDNIPLDHTNSIYKAAKLFRETYNISDGFKFIVKKNIPIESGLGGESTDAAGTLILLNEYYKLNISKKELAKLGIKIGSDVPYFIYSGYMEVTSIGDVVKTPTINNPYKWYILITPDFGLNTGEMFKKIDNYEFKKVPIKLPYNDFMKVVPVSIIDIKNYLDSNNISNHTLSGSGSSYYIALEKRNIFLYKKIKEYYNNYKVILVKNSNNFMIY